MPHVVPLIEAVAKLMTSIISTKESAEAIPTVILSKNIMANGRWTREQIKLAFHLYCQLPYGRIYGRNPEIIALAKVIGRTSDAVAMKMLNIASLDPAITSTGRVALGNASALDREVWDEFHSDWERLALESHLLRQQLDNDSLEDLEPENDELVPSDFTGETRQVLTAQRIKQHFFPPYGAKQLSGSLLHVGSFRFTLAHCQPHRAMEQRQVQSTQPQKWTLPFRHP